MELACSRLAPKTKEALKGPLHMVPDKIAGILRSKIDVEDRHGKVVGTLAVLVIEIDDAEKFVTEIDFGGIVLAGTRLDDDLWVQKALEIVVDLLDFVGVHDLLRQILRSNRSAFGTGERRK
jgi:hypothetical protein